MDTYRAERHQAMDTFRVERHQAMVTCRLERHQAMDTCRLERHQAMQYLETQVRNGRDVISLTRRAPFTSKNICDTHFC
jgi:hypothetical protein